MKCAYFVCPHIGGTYSVFTRLRSSLGETGPKSGRESGIELRWLAAGSTGNTISVPSGHGLDDAHRSGDAIDPMGVLDEKTRARRMVEFLRDNRFDAVFVNVLSNRFETNLVRYLPSDILRVMIVHNITPGTYAAARSIRDYVHATVGVSKRSCDDLVRRYGFEADRTLVIPNGTTCNQSFRRASKPSGLDQPLQLLFLGRIEDSSKGVFWLPDILHQLRCNWNLTVAGDGPDLQQLRNKLSTFSDRVHFAGAVPPSDVIELIGRHDLMLMPSRFEGCPMSLIEAMSEGCPAIVSNISGVTDTIVTDGEDGLLFPVGNCRLAARQIDRFAGDPELRSAMAQAAFEKVTRTFNNDVIGGAYANLLTRLKVNPPEIAPPLPLSQWSMPTALHSSLRSRLPTPVKNWLRQMRERLHTGWSAA